MDEVRPEDLVEQIERGDAPAILDVRTRAEFDRGHVPGAVNVPFTSLLFGSPELPLEFVRGHAPFGAQLSQVENGLEYYAHAPSSLVYRPATGATTLRGSFGLYDGAYAPTNAGACRMGVLKL